MLAHVLTFTYMSVKQLSQLGQKKGDGKTTCHTTKFNVSEAILLNKAVQTCAMSYKAKATELI